MPRRSTSCAAQRSIFRRGDRAVARRGRGRPDVAAGEFVALEGPSGSGKTTLLQLLGALDRAERRAGLLRGTRPGRLRDRELAELRLRAFGFVFQQFNLIPTLTAVRTSRRARARSASARLELRDRVFALLAEVGLAERATHLPRNSRAASSSASPSRAHSWPSRASSSPTSRPETSTPRAGAEVLELLAGLAARARRDGDRRHAQPDLAVRAPRRLAMRDGRIAAPGAPALAAR